MKTAAEDVDSLMVHGTPEARAARIRQFQSIKCEAYQQALTDAGKRAVPLSGHRVVMIADILDLRDSKKPKDF